MHQPATMSHSPIKASNFIGMHVVNPEGEDLGSIKEMILDPSSGGIAYAIVLFGGFLGMGQKLCAIPFGALDYDGTRHDYVLKVSKERLTRAPGFDPDRWPSLSDEAWHRNVSDYYGRSPYWE